MTESETWKDIAGYEGLYKVSSLGRIKSLKRRGILADFIMKAGVNNWGYPIIILCKSAKQNLYKIHRLVAQSFIANLDNLEQVNHIDCDKLNNRVENLEWCTGVDNIRHAFKNGLIKISDECKKSIGAHTAERQLKVVTVIDTLTNKSETYGSITIASKALGCSVSGISTCFKRNSLLFNRYKPVLQLKKNVA